MSGVNKVIIVGHLGKDPELKTTGSGKSVCSFSVAVGESWGGKEHTEWFNITVWEKTGENCAKYLAKGSQVYIEGRMRTESYEKDGQKRYITKIIADTVQFLSSKKAATGPTKNADGQDPFGSDEQPF